MRVENLKRWQWAVIGLVLGLCVSLYRGYIGHHGYLDRRTTMEAAQFERLISRPSSASGGQPILRNIAVYQLRDGSYWLTAEQLIRRQDGQQAYIPVKIPAKTPFVSRNTPSGQAPKDQTVVDFLRSAKQKNPNLTFSTRWWDVNPARSLIYGAAGIVLVGGLWPQVVKLLVGAGYGRPVKDPEYDLSRFGNAEADGAAGGAKADPTPEQVDQMRALEAELERKLAATQAELSAAPDPPEADGAAEQPIRALSNAPLEVRADAKPAQQKDYAGEYYPTETHVKKPHE